MSLQDDYFDLNASLKHEDNKALNRIWEAFCQMEEEQESLCELRGNVRAMIRNSGILVQEI